MIIWSVISFNPHRLWKFHRIPAKIQPSAYVQQSKSVKRLYRMQLEIRLREQWFFWSLPRADPLQIQFTRQLFHLYQVHMCK